MVTARPNVQAIFNEAIARDSDEDRLKYLDDVCANQPELRARVDALLSAHSEAGGFFGGQMAATEFQPIIERPGSQIGPYKLLQQIGEGGMGVVYMAEQTQPIERRVALKIIKPGMDTRQVIARFEAERQALAMMDHPNIARALDAGLTGSGRPYFVMELVKGVPITEYCDEHQLTPRERLEVFVPVCQAIQHAHQKGIIHRDIKPSNVLVANYDDSAVPKVIDFGVAKAINHRLTEKTMFTEFGQVLGTFEYMSPEQARLNQWDVDTRTDIYSLGVLLYELLSGETPFDRQRLRSEAFDELLRIIREEEPPRPSMRLSSSDSLPTIASKRRTEPRKLGVIIHGELDWIVMKSLEKDRTRRYETAHNFAEDIEHYLNNETVEACPPSAAYRLRKFARRNKPAIAAVLAVTAALLIGLTTSVWQAFRANYEAENAIASANRAERELTRANEVKRLFEQMLESVEPLVSQGADTELLREVLDNTADHLNEGHVEDELVASEMHYLVGGVYEGIALYPEAIDQLSRAADILARERPTDLITARVMCDLGSAYRSTLEFEQAERWISRALEISRQHVDNNPYTSKILTELATTLMEQGQLEKAETHFLKALSIDGSKQGIAIRYRSDALHGMGMICSNLGRYEEAEDYINKTIDLRKTIDPPIIGDIMAARANLAALYHETQRYDDAVRINEQLLKESENVYGKLHDYTMSITVNLANQYMVRGYLAEDDDLTAKAKQMFERVTEIFNKLPNAETNAEAVEALANANLGLASIAMLQNDVDRAEEKYHQAIQIGEQHFSKDHHWVTELRIEMAKGHFNRAMSYGDARSADKAKAIAIQILKSHETSPKLEATNNVLMAAREMLAHLYQRDGELEKAEQMLLELAEQLAHNSPKWLALKIVIGNFYMNQERHADAIGMFQEAIDGMENLPNPDDRRLSAAMCNLGLCYFATGEYPEARDQLEETLRWMEGRLPENHNFRLNALNGLAHSYMKLDEPDKSIPLYQEFFELKIPKVDGKMDAETLNELAWNLLTHEYEELQDPAQALRLSRQACKLARFMKSKKLGAYLDTLALAQHRTGDTPSAVVTQREAIDKLPGAAQNPQFTEMSERLEEYEQAEESADKKEDEEKPPATSVAPHSEN